VYYFVIELSSIGGCPLKEASGHFFLSNKILVVIFIVLCSGYISSHIWYFGIVLQVKSITSGIRALSRAGGISKF